MSQALLRPPYSKVGVCSRQNPSSCLLKAVLWCPPAGLQASSESHLIFLLQQLWFPPAGNTKVSPGPDSSHLPAQAPSPEGCSGHHQPRTDTDPRHSLKDSIPLCPLNHCSSVAAYRLQKKKKRSIFSILPRKRAPWEYGAVLALPFEEKNHCLK